MTMSGEGRAALQAIETMTEEEAAAWIAAGDYSSIGGVSISAQNARRIAELLDTPEVVPFDLNNTDGIRPNPPPPPFGTVDRKAGRGQQEFLVFTFKQVFVPSY